MRWIEAGRVTSRPGGLRGVLSVLFWIWGIAGALVSALILDSLFRTGGTLGDTAVLQAVSLIWIAGLLLFGMGALLAPTRYKIEQIENDRG